MSSPTDAASAPGPEGWPPGFVADPAGWPAPVRRFTEQRWLIDAAIKTIGIDWDQGRTRYIGNAGGVGAEGDFARAREQISKLADVARVYATAAARRERLADAAIRDGHEVTARTHAFIASILYGTAEWTFFLSPDAVRAAREDNLRKLRCYDLWMARAAHPSRRLRIPYGGGTLSAVLHLPRGASASAPVPCVLHVGGMDSFKEHAVAVESDRFLERGIARLIFDGPGQGEAVLEGAFLSETSMIEAGLAALAVMRAQPEIDAGRLGVTGVSFGSWWATQLAAHAPDLAGTAVWAVVHEPGLHSIFEEVTPTFKARFMAMAGFTDEAVFDAFARRWTLAPLAPRIRAPYLVLAGEDDELSPIRHTYDVLAAVLGPRQLVLYRGEKHSIGGGPAARLGPNALDLAADWFVDRFAGREPAETATLVETSGAAETVALGPWLERRLG
jgi:dienelactone hydrolase